MAIRGRLWTRCALVISLQGLLACGPGQVAPEETGGELLAGTEAYDFLQSHDFSVSPDGRWLLFARNATPGPPPPGLDLVGHMLRDLSAYLVYDLSRRKATRVVLGPEARDVALRYEFYLPTGGCWVPKGDGWWAAVALPGQYLIADPDVPNPEWAVDDTEPYGYRDHCPLDIRWAVPEVLGRFRFAERGGRRISIVDAEDTEVVLARHRAPWLPWTDISLSRIRLAPGGTHVAYAATAAFGSFAGRTTAFVLPSEAGPGPTALASEVGTVRWGVDDTTLYATVVGERGRGIYRWRVAAATDPNRTEKRPSP